MPYDYISATLKKRPAYRCEKSMSENNPLFSVVIPCYNYGHCVGRAIESALNQSADCEFDITVIDDGSSDNSAQVVAAYVDALPERVRYIFQNNSGPAAARNRGIDSTRGRYLIFLDADDELTPDALKIFSAAITTSPNAGLIIGGHDSQHDIQHDNNNGTNKSKSGKRKYHSPGQLPSDRVAVFHRYLQNKLGMANGAIAMRREVFNNIRYNPELRQSEDIPVFAAIFANYFAVTVDQSTAIIYRHEGSLRSNTDWAEKMGFLLVDEIFNHQLPAECYRYQRWYRSQKGLSLFRMYFLVGQKHKAASYYHQAIKQYPKNIMRWAYLRKYIKMRLLP